MNIFRLIRKPWSCLPARVRGLHRATGSTASTAELAPMLAAAVAVALYLAAPGTPHAMRPVPTGKFPAFELPVKPPGPPPLKVSVTGYSSTPDQTDDTPFLTASNTRVRAGIIALSRDLLREFTPGAPFGFGDAVELVGVGTFHVEDTMAHRFRNRVDIWFETRNEARHWGKRSSRLRHAPVVVEPELAWRPPSSPVDLPAAALFQPALSD